MLAHYPKSDGSYEYMWSHNIVLAKLLPMETKRENTTAVLCVSCSGLASIYVCIHLRIYYMYKWIGRQIHATFVR